MNKTASILKMGEADEKIIGQVLNGNRNAYALLVDEYKDRVYSLALGIVRNRELAEEIAQDAFVKAFGSLKKFRKEAGFSTWIYRITYNTAISELRKKKKTSQVAEEQFENLASTQANEALAEADEKEARLEMIEKAVKELPPEEQLMVTLYYLEENSVQQISKVTGFSASNVKVKLFRLRKKLRQLVENVASKEALVY